MQFSTREHRLYNAVKVLESRGYSVGSKRAEATVQFGTKVLETLKLVILKYQKTWPLIIKSQKCTRRRASKASKLST